ncbi:hypothetical protein [Micromonospora sp. NPDC004551]|uniref:hypothetical protein n=1 Tax=Micromonospora sp. NPDC004551 TaxID=3154284 RepID=UPI0033B34ED5
MDQITFEAPLWAWVAVGAVIAVMLAVDVFAHRDHLVIDLREALLRSAAWIIAGVTFGLVIRLWRGSGPAAAYYSGYLLEKALSVDNVFVFALPVGKLPVWLTLAVVVLTPATAVAGSAVPARRGTRAR